MGDGRLPARGLVTAQVCSAIPTGAHYRPATQETHLPAANETLPCNPHRSRPHTDQHQHTLVNGALWTLIVKVKNPDDFGPERESGGVVREEREEEDEEQVEERELMDVWII
ncbi:unnamed protein product [Pleuronectes platessa]|uniref:Uncharacterized protein n=1 Tax=Pleuronectes platessa TaxID=8262 RepID=A0A9N7YFG7_PLEPL|nr:unnamed protein product [Pleuronectes platessa]